MSQAVDFQVNKEDLHNSRIVELPAAADAPLADGEVLVQVDVFAFTANNITYAVFGDAMQYWDFFPAHPGHEEGWRRIPVWGFGDVVRSNAEGIEVGERLYGYFPMASHVTLRAEHVNEHSFRDGAAHRAHLHPVYNTYQRVAADPGYRADHESQQMVLRPLFTTSFLIDDFLADADFHGAAQVIVTSASSKTSLALAHQLHALRADAVKVVGLTSASNVGFCEALGTYDQVVSYEDLEKIDADVPAVSVDMAGNGSVLRRIHEHFEDNLRYSCLVGGTHWEDRGGAGPMPGPAPQLFFAPDQIKKRTEDWGGAGYNERLGAAWLAFVEASGDWLTLSRSEGPEAVARVYQEVLGGTADPSVGLLVSLN